MVSLCWRAYGFGMLSLCFCLLSPSCRRAKQLSKVRPGRLQLKRPSPWVGKMVSWRPPRDSWAPGRRRPIRHRVWAALGALLAALGSLGASSGRFEPSGKCQGGLRRLQWQFGRPFWRVMLEVCLGSLEDNDIVEVTFFLFVRACFGIVVGLVCLASRRGRRATNL